MSTSPLTPDTLPDTGLAVRAAEAAAALLPAVTELMPAGAQPGSEHVTEPFAGAATARLDRADGTSHLLAVLVGQDLVQALAESPLGGLDLAAAVQPAVDAAAQVLGASPRAASVTDLKLVVADLGGPFTAVPLVGEGIDAAVLVPDALLAPLATPAGLPDASGSAEQSATAGITAAATSGARSGGTVTAVVPQQITRATSQMFASTAPAPAQRGIEMLAGVDMEVTVELGRTRMPVRDLLALAPGTVLELDRAADGPADLLVNGRLIARGEVVVVDEDFGLRITEIVEDTGA